jgi:hypothetical protein
MEFNMDEFIKLPYKEMVAKVTAGAPINCTWRDVSDWLYETYSQEDLIKYNVALYKALCEESDIDNESDQADEIREMCESPWYAVEDTNLLNEAIFEVVKSRGEV